MKQILKDTAGLGTGLWLLGYLASLVLFFSPSAASMGWGDRVAAGIPAG